MILLKGEIMKATEKLRKHDVDMCHGPLFIKIIKFFIPVMLSNMLQLLYNATDQAVVGRFAGSDALAAVGSTASLTNFIVCLVVGLSVGTNSVVARLYGSGNDKAVSRAVHTSMALSAICGIAVGAIGFIVCRPLLLLMGTQADVIDSAVLYMRISFAGFPLVAIYNFSSAVLRAIGDTKRPMLFLVVSGFINVVLNLVFVIKFHMGVAGVAVATIIAQTVSGFLTVRWLMRVDGSYKFYISKLRIHKSECVSIVRVGIPAGLQSSMFSISNIVIQSGINSISKAAVSGCAAAANVDNFVYQAVNSLYHASLAFCGQNYGAKNYARIKKTVLYCTGIVTVVGLGVGTLVYLFAEPLLNIFITDSPEAVMYGKERIMLTCLPYFICGFMEVGCGALRGINHALPALINSVFGACFLRVVWIYTVFRAYPSISVLFISYPITWAVSAILHFAMFAYFFKKMQNGDGAKLKATE